MTQIATVEKVLAGGYAEISVPRKSACGHDCEECAGCGMTGAAIHARARNDVGAQKGDKVVVESSTKKLLGVVALVYLLPVVGFLLGTRRRWPTRRSTPVRRCSIWAAAAAPACWSSSMPSNRPPA